VIEGNIIGTTLGGSMGVGNGSSGVRITGGANNRIGGSTPGARNIISGNLSDGILIQNGGATGNVVQGNYIGTDAAGTAALGNGVHGIMLTSGAAGNTIGGTTAAERNVISGNTNAGIFLGGTGNQALGNFIGTNASGTAALANNVGISIVGGTGQVIGGPTGTTPGGACTGACNVISGNTLQGISIGAPGSTGAVVQGNYIGTDVTGMAAIPNGNYGVNLQAGTTNNTVGGTPPAARNVISGNTNTGVYIENTATANNIVQGNYIGVNTTGSVALPNGVFGVRITAGANTNTIGGTAAGAGNVISGNGNDGIEISSATSTGNLVQGNYIGTNAAGTAALPNVQNGVNINGAPSNTIGGLTATPGTGAGNVISGNTQAGILIQSTAGNSNVIQGNIVGLVAAGTTALANGGPGIGLSNSGAQIGSANAQARNVISGNSNGVLVANSGTNHNVLIQGNYIGTDLTGTVNRGNASSGVDIGNAPGTVVGGTAAGAGNVIGGSGSIGVFVHTNTGTGVLIQGNKIGVGADGTTQIQNVTGVHLATTNTTIGGTAAGASNTIAFNTADGVVVVGATSTGNAILVNSIHSNGQLAIDLGNDGVTPNDPGDVDASPNALQNFPVLTSAVNSGGLTTVTGSLNSTANTTFRVEFFSNAACDASGNGEGQSFLGFTNVTTDGTGNIPVSLGGLAASIGQFITATATNTTTNDTSEFSACVQVVSGVAQAPVASGQAEVATEDQPQLITLAASDADSASLTFSLVQGALHGTLSAIGAPNCTVIAGGSNCTATVTYTGDLHFNGADSFTFRVSDGGQTSNVATVSLSVAVAPDTPLAVANTATVAAGAGPTFIDVLANDTDPDNLTPPFNTGLAVTAASQPPAGQGTTTFFAGGVTYAPGTFTGTTNFTYTIGDPGACVLPSCTATVTVTVPAANQAALSVTASGGGTVTGGGITCGAGGTDCTELFTIPAPPATAPEATLTATPTLGSQFLGWSGACSGTGTCTVVMSQARSVTAQFTATAYVLALTPQLGTGRGIIFSNPGGLSCGAACQATFDANALITLTAIPDAGSVFSGWTGGGCTGTGPCAVTLAMATTVTYRFNESGLDGDADGLPDATETADVTQRTDPAHPDTDRDGVPDGIDNCPLTVNLDQVDTDQDTQLERRKVLGNACDVDADNDGFPDKQPDTVTVPPQPSPGFPLQLFVALAPGPTTDNCPLHFNPDQTDRDGDGKGDACDLDVDGDGFGRLDFREVFADSLVSPSSAATLYDATTGAELGAYPGGPVPPGQIRGGDCDDASALAVPGGSDCPIGGQKPPSNNPPPDADADGLTDTQEASLGTSPTNPDTDGDGVGDLPDNCKLTANASQANLDSDGAGDACDTDADNDGVPDKSATFVPIPVGSGGDNCPLVANANQLDFDGDQIGDACDTDMDADGVADKTAALVTISPANGGDNCPLMANADQQDSDDDDIGNVCDPTPLPARYIVRWTMTGGTPTGVYAEWLPTVGGTATAQLEVIDTQTNLPVNPQPAITVATESVSSYPGQYTNDSSTATTPDLTYTVGGSVVTFTSQDYGGKITVQATASFTDDAGTPVMATGSFTLPLDANNNNLADAWEAQYSGVTLTEAGDGDTSPNNNLTGDGLSNFKEYRGVMWDDLTFIGTNATYFTATYLPQRSPHHFRLNPLRKDLFVRYTGFDTAGCGCPFALGAAFADAGVDVHALDQALVTAATGLTNLDTVLVTNNTTGNYSTENGHIRKSSGVRNWVWSTKGYSFIGTASAYGTEQTNGVTYSYQMAQDFYFLDRPYQDGGGVTAANGIFEPATAGSTAEDTNDDGTRQNSEDRNPDNGQLDGDRYIPNALNKQFTTFDVNNNGRVELPVVATAGQVTVEYTKEQVIKHTITHELGHSVGMAGGHCDCPGTLMHQYSTDWQRDGSFSTVSKGEMKIHNQ
jgi:hypothetical protein